MRRILILAVLALVLLPSVSAVPPSACAVDSINITNTATIALLGDRLHVNAELSGTGDCLGEAVAYEVKWVNGSNFIMDGGVIEPRCWDYFDIPVSSSTVTTEGDDIPEWCLLLVDSSDEVHFQIPIDSPRYKIDDLYEVCVEADGVTGCQNVTIYTPIVTANFTSVVPLGEDFTAYGAVKSGSGYIGGIDCRLEIYEDTLAKRYLGSSDIFTTNADGEFMFSFPITRANDFRVRSDLYEYEIHCAGGEVEGMFNVTEPLGISEETISGMLWFKNNFGAIFSILFIIMFSIFTLKLLIWWKR